MCNRPTLPCIYRIVSLRVFAKRGGEDVILAEADTSLILRGGRHRDKVGTLSVKTHQQTHEARLLGAGDTRQGRRD